MVDGIANDVGQRVFDRFQKGLAQFCFSPFHDQFYLLAVILRQITDEAGKLLPNVSNRLHSGLHDCILKLSGNEVHSLGRSRLCGIITLSSVL